MLAEKVDGPHRARTIAGMGLLWARLFATTFLAILFLQSGLDKVLDRGGNLDFLKSHFQKTPLAQLTATMLTVITILELAAGLLCGVGVLQLLFTKKPTLAFWGAFTSAGALTCLFFGQRLAKDYGGAAVLVPYFLLALVALLLNQPTAISRWGL